MVRFVSGESHGILCRGLGEAEASPVVASLCEFVTPCPSPWISFLCVHLLFLFPSDVSFPSFPSPFPDHSISFDY